MRVLVIEDFDLLRDSICQGLREAGFAVDAAGDGETGLWRARSAAYDVIVLDLMLPKVDGLTVLRQLRAAGAPTHILILTARDTTADRIRGLNAGADDYLVKPFEFAELLARVRALVRRQYQAKNPLLRVEDLEIDTAARAVRRARKPLDLTPREYALLEFLALRQGEVVTRTDIWEHVYEFNSEASSNVVDVFIGHLRRKVDLPGLSPLIVTRRGHGYMLGRPR
jgi:DNA-binding response OmpR family regulator